MLQLSWSVSSTIPLFDSISTNEAPRCRLELDQLGLEILVGVISV